MPVSVVCESAVSSAIRDSLQSSISTQSASSVSCATAAANNQLRSPQHQQINCNGASSQAGDDLQNRINISAKRVLMHRIEFEEMNGGFNNTVRDTLKGKYIVLKSSVATTANALATNSSNGHHNSNGSGKSDKKEASATTTPTNIIATSALHQSNQLPQPKRMLFPRENVHIGWKSTDLKWTIGAGFINLGNTCYLNSTLQALFHVPSFASWLRSDTIHREQCEESGGGSDGCIICAMAKTLLSSQSSPHPIKPYSVYSKLRFVCKHLQMGRQEDAHEFLRYLVEAMEKSYLGRFKGSKEFDQHSKETTPLNQILGGYLKTAVRCLSCHHVSTTFQHFEDLLLDIRKATSVEEGLDSYFSREYLEDMGYKCESCKKKVSATKQFSLERAPITLCIQLKRFSVMGGKLNKHITIRQKLDLSPYVSQKQPNQNLSYKLVSMVTHLGSSPNCGHYTAIGLTESGNYYQFDDSAVRSISVPNVLNTNSYIMFYELDQQAGNVKYNGFTASPVNSSNKTSTMTSKDSAKMHENSNHGSLNTTTTSVSSNPPIRRIILTSSNFIGPRLPTQQTSSDASHKTQNSFASGVSSINIINTKAGNNYSMLGSKLVASGPLKVVTTTTTGQQKPENKLIVYKQQPNGAMTSPMKRTAATAFPLSPPSPKLQALSQNGSANSNAHESINSISNCNSIQRKSILQYDSDETIRSAAAKRKLLPSMPKLNGIEESTASTAAVVNKPPVGSILLVNGGRQSNGINVTPEKPRSLVPYDSDEDSSLSDNDESKSPPLLKTKTGIWQVTKIETDSPPRAQQPRLTNPFATSLVSSSSTTTNGSKEKGTNSVKKFSSNAAEIDLKDQKDETVNHLLKMGHRGYGAPVLSWNGQKTSIEKEVQEEKRDEKRRQYEMEEETEMDRGRQKKTKYNGIQQSRDTNPGFNPFQEQQNQQNSGGGQRRNFSSGATRPFSNHNTYRQSNGGNHRSHQNNFNRGRRGGGGPSNGNSGFNRSNNFHNHSTYQQRNENSNYHRRD